MQKNTNEVCFDRKEVFPDDHKLKELFGDVYPAYQNILTLTGSYPHEWKYYGKKYGWQLKVTRKGKALLYLIPLEKSFRVGFAVREAEKETLLKSRLSAKVKEELIKAKRYPEGYGLRLTVKRKSDMGAVRLVIETLKSLRS